MKETRFISIALMAAAAWAMVGVWSGVAGEEDAPEAEQGLEHWPASAAPVQMAEFVVSGRKLKGRITSEDDRMIRIERLGSGEIGYEKTRLQHLKRYEVPASIFHESVGDYHAAKTWDFDDDESDFIRARKAYQRALACLPTPVVKERIQKKYDGILKERDEWQEEALKRQELLTAEQETENARLQKELTQEKLDALEELSQTKEELQTRISGLRGDVAALARQIRSMDRSMAKMAEDIEDLEDRWRRRPTVLIYDLRRSYDSLRSRIQRLEADVRKQQGN